MLLDDGQSEKVIEAAGARFPKTFILGAQGLTASSFMGLFQNSSSISFRWVRFELPAHQGRASSAVATVHRTARHEGQGGGAL